jgi:hypothetical protein
MKKVPRPEGDIGDLFERVKETAAEVLDRTVEVLGAARGETDLEQMKQNAASAVEPSRGCVQLADALAQLKRRRRKPRFISSVTPPARSSSDTCSTCCRRASST